MSGMPLDFQIDGFQALLLKGKLRYRIFNQISEKMMGLRTLYLKLMSSTEPIEPMSTARLSCTQLDTHAHSKQKTQSRGNQRKDCPA